MDKSLILVFTVISIIILISCSTESTTLYQLRTNVEPDGAGEVNPKFEEFEEGATVTIRAIANDDWIFSRWEGASLEDSSVAEIIMVRDFEITAVFEEPKFYFTEGGTLKCQEAEVGDTQIIQGTEYIALDRLQLIEFVLQNDASRVCTSLITDLSNFNWKFRE